jgi:hypothetical protein
VSVWLDAPWMVHGDGGELAEDLVALLLGEPSGLACDELGRRLERRRCDVLDALRCDPRFERCGGGRGTRWRTTVAMVPEGAWDGLGRKARSSPDREPIPGAPVS